MSHRPPRHPLPRGVIWRKLTLGEGHAGQPLGEWAYVTPGHPVGLRESALKAAAPEEQASTALFWFLSNYKPSDGRDLGHGARPHGVPPEPFWTPGTILLEEFAGLIPADVLSDLSSGLQAQAGFWCLLPAQRQIELPEQGDPASLRAAAEEALSRLDEALRDIVALRGSMGHNQGPSILDAPTEAAVIQATADARSGLAAGAGGAPEVTKAKLVLLSVATLMGPEPLKGLVNKAGQDMYEPAKAIAFRLFHSLVEASLVLGHWALAGLPGL